MAPLISLGVAAGSAVVRTVAVPVVKAGLSATTSFFIGMGSGALTALGIGGIVRKARQPKKEEPKTEHKKEEHKKD